MQQQLDAQFEASKDARIAALEAELAEARAHQAATSEILSVIRRSPSEVQRVLEQISESVARLCEADYTAFFRLRDGKYHVGASNRMGSAFIDSLVDNPISPGRNTCVGRTALERRIVHVDDALEDKELTTSANLERQRVSGVRTVLGVPIMSGGEAVAVVFLARAAVRAFSEQQIALVQTLGGQALIAIENARLFEAEQTRTKELTESLEYQTATSEVLSVISRSRFDLQPVLDAIVQTAARLCRADKALIRRRQGDAYRIEAQIGHKPETMAFLECSPVRPGRDTIVGRVVLERTTVHVPDVLSDAEFDRSDLLAQVEFRSALAVPLLRQDDLLGVVLLMRNALAPFDAREIALVETFASQAVIAIENARLFEAEQTRTKELQESLEYQTAISDVLGVIARSPNELQPVLDQIVRTAAELGRADIVGLRRREGEDFPLVAHRGYSDSQIAWLKQNYETPRSGVLYDTIRGRKTTHVVQAMAPERGDSVGVAQAVGNKVALGVPLLRHGELIGTLFLARREAKPFSERQIKLVETFADQAVIAIENARLFEAVQTRTKELAQSVDELRALGEVGQAVSSSLDKDKVLQTVLENACRMARASGGTVYVFDKDTGTFRLEAGYNMSAEHTERVRAAPMRMGDPVVGESALRRESVVIEDLKAEDSSRSPLIDILLRAGVRAILSMPLIHQGEVIGALAVRRSYPGPFAPETVKLLEAFAAQSAIAVNNARLFEEVHLRTKEVQEALDYQTATSEVLGVISRSPNELQPVLDVIAATGARLCQAEFATLFLVSGNKCIVVASNNVESDFVRYLRESPPTLIPGSPTGRAALFGKTVHIPDLLEWSEYSRRDAQKVGRQRTIVSVPLLRNGTVVGVISLMRTAMRPFTDRQIALVETFADQAVIAISNARLFEEVQARSRELQEALEYQTATSSVLGVISRSPNELAPVLDAIARTAHNICQADRSSVWYLNADRFELTASVGMSDEDRTYLARNPVAIGPGSLAGRCVLAKQTIHMADRLADADHPVNEQALRTNARTMLCVPLMRQGTPIGVVTMTRTVVRPFTRQQISLVETFADQAVIAINNARMFHEIEEKGEQLRLASQHKSQFLANMSHELRTPLNAILGYTELMQDGIYGDLPDKAGGVLERVQSNGKHLLGLINQVLDLSKIEAGQLKLQLAEYSIGSVVETVLAATESLATEKKLKLAPEVANDMPRGIGDERRIAQVLLNLVGNAIKFTDEGEVRVQAGHFAGRYQVAVVDTGPGIPRDEQARIFEEFHQVDSSNTKAKGGTGLGLAIAKRIVELHGGRIWVESEQGRGAAFRFEIPVVCELRENQDDETHTRH